MSGFGDGSGFGLGYVVRNRPGVDHRAQFAERERQVDAARHRGGVALGLEAGRALSRAERAAGRLEQESLTGAERARLRDLVERELDEAGALAARASRTALGTAAGREALARAELRRKVDAALASARARRAAARPGRSVTSPVPARATRPARKVPVRPVGARKSVPAGRVSVRDAALRVRDEQIAAGRVPSFQSVISEVGSRLGVHRV